MAARRRRPWVTATVAVAAVASTVMVGPPAASATGPTGAGPTKAEVSTHRITLITGDIVTVTTRAGDDRPAISLDPTGPSRGNAQVNHTDGATYVVPTAATEAVASDAVDLALFEIEGLITNRHDDRSTDSVPVLLDNRTGRRQPVPPGQARVKNRLESIHSVGARVAKSQTAAFWRATDTVAERDAAAVGKIWLDRTVRVTLADSVPQIKAPQLWQAGVDGTGVTVAVLDTGVDTNHPDLRGRVSVARNFTDSADAVDRHGHGTHVAATIGGSGAGNGAKGVAPGADLIVGKVLGDSGSGTYSSIIDGMEWAAESGADVVNMSLGTSQPDNGNGPLSSALNQLADRHGTLFVVAAGNSGPNTIGEPASAARALTVGAVSKSGALAGFSSTGPRVGDFAVKPELTAPGVDILAARANGTTMGTPSGEHYTLASGTSMATPHVAGAAALLKQSHPTWDDGRLKTTLVNSTDQGAYRADQGGSGQLNVARAATQQARAIPATLNLGAVRYAPDGGYAPLRGQVTLHNDASTGRTFALTATGVAATGQQMPAGSLALDQSTVTVPGGGTAVVTLTLDPNPLTRERVYSGFVTAVSSDSTASLRVPFSVYLEPVLHEVRITGVGRDGAKAGGPSQVVLLNESAAAAPTRAQFVNGVATARVKPGVYTIITSIYTSDTSGAWIESVAMSYRPQVDLTNGDTGYLLDARTAAEVVVDAGRPTERLGSAIGYLRVQQNRGYHDWMTLVSPDVKHVHLFPSAAPSTGSQEITIHSTLVAPQLTATVAGGQGLTLTPTQLDGAQRFEGQASLELADVGTGTAEEFRRVDVRGKLVLAARSDVPIAQVIETAATRGAKAVAIGNGRPGRLVAQAGSRSLPAFALYGEQGAALSRLAATRDDVVVKLAGTPYSPFAYSLVTPLASVAEGPLRQSVDQLDTARITARNHARQDTTGTSVFWNRRASSYYWVTSEVPTRLGAVQEQWVSADPRTQVQKGLALGDAKFLTYEQTYRSYQPGSHHTVDWLRVSSPQIVENQPGWFAQGYQSWSGRASLTLAARPFPDTDPTHIEFADLGDEYSLTLSRDGETVGRATYWYGNFTIPTDKARYEAVLAASRSLPGWGFATRSTTKWTFEAGGSTASNSPISMPQVGYDIDAGLDNRVRAGIPQTLTVTARPWRADGAAVVDVTVRASYDGGKTWTRLPLKSTGDAGAYTATFTVPAGATSSGYVSLRTTATDATGHSVDQTVERAFGLEAR
ncbi:Serine protease, subtilisin family [Micromonospora pallida]|uniref:Serine protease, subtilisin family n=1 Tax=Micromonospora pallida TaxID=145854 RepID=A0A1C6SBA7_9ACTN|nr:S8 family serine peptidase [Micromonospora pallida]SCL26770.1 Serine protease, subtilisin family [Micromonospora pallida]